MERFDPVEAELSGTTLIEASAGTGKTHNITTLFVRLLLERGLSIDRILVVTYTNAATFELRRRIRSRLSEALVRCGDPSSASDEDLRRLLERRRDRAGRDRALLEEAVHSFDEAAIGTIHGFCQRVLEEYAFESEAAFGAELVADESSLWAEIAHDFWVRELLEADPMVLETLREVGETPATLSVLAKRVLSEPDLEILPERVEVPEAGDRAAWETAFERVHREWIERGEEVLEALERARSEGVLKRNLFTDKFFREIRDQMEKALRVAVPSVAARAERFERLTAEGVHEGTVQAAKNRVPTDPFFEACQELWDLDRTFRAYLEAWHVAFQMRFVEFARAEAVTRKERARRQSFDDLLVTVRDALRGPGGDELAARLRERYSAAMIDEFQDTDPIQWAIFHRIWGSGEAPLFLIGDPKQAIYSFRGADVRTYLEAAATARRRWNLSTNYRSDPGLLRALNTVFARDGDPFLEPAIVYHPVEGEPGRQDAAERPFSVWFLEREGLDLARRKGEPIRATAAKREIPLRIASHVRRLLESADRIRVPDRTDAPPRLLGPQDVAVLCRTNFEAYEVHRALSALRIPAVVHGDRSVFESPEAIDVLAVLEAMAEPGDPRLLRGALVTSLFGVSGNDLQELAENEAAWDARVDAFLRWQGIWRRRGFMQAFRELLEEPSGRDPLTVPGRLLDLPLGERRLTNVLHVAELLHEVSIREHRGPAELIDWLRTQTTSRTAGLAREEVQIRLESDARAVSLTTVHKAKGLEWPVVLCPYLWRELALGSEENRRVRFHPPGEGVKVRLDLGSEDLQANRGRAQDECRAENRRLLYVALTRARHRVAPVWGAIDGPSSRGLAALLADPSASDAAMLEELASLADASGGTVAVEKLPPAEARPWGGEGGLPTPLDYRRFARGEVDRDFRASSFTEMTRRSPVEADAGRDHDEGADAPELGIEPAIDGSRIPLADFPRGAAAGTIVHGILEHLDFVEAAREAPVERVRDRLKATAIEAHWVEPLAEGLRRMVSRPLPGTDPGVSLAEIDPGHRKSEMEFVLPVEPVAPGGRVTPATLADVFAGHARKEFGERYVERVRSLGFPALHGFLRGFVDLVFVASGRHYVVDYKTNHLGDRPEDYGSARLRGAMESHHYVLQAHLYLVALHRHLRLRLAGYDYDAHVGGALYLFLRGIDDGSDSGVFFHRPRRDTIEALSALFGEIRG